MDAADLLGRLHRAEAILDTLGRQEADAILGSDGVMLMCASEAREKERQSREALRESEQRFRTMANAAPVLIWLAGPDGRRIWFNQRWLDFTGRPLADECSHWTTGVHADDLARGLPGLLDSTDPCAEFETEYRLQHADGQYRWLLERGVPHHGPDGEFLGHIGSCVDITLRKAAEDEYRTLAYYDPLTGLANRRCLFERLAQALASSSRHHREGALLFIDLDDFKHINDTLGHQTGDRLLQEAARRLGSCIRHGDTLARLGGDEFVVMLEYLGEGHEQALSQARRVAENILARLTAPYSLDGHQCTSTPSVGITLFKGLRQTPDEVLRQADQAMYAAKQAGRNTLRLFDPEGRAQRSQLR